jgi:hypothetical protein
LRLANRARIAATDGKNASLIQALTG